MRLVGLIGFPGFTGLLALVGFLGLLGLIGLIGLIIGLIERPLEGLGCFLIVLRFLVHVAVRELPRFRKAKP